MILLTGATGKTGAAAAEFLLKENVPLRALVRDEERAAPLAESGVDLEVGDIADPDILKRAFRDVERAALICANSRHQLEHETQFVDLARAAGVKHVVKLSSMEAVPDNRGAIAQIHVQSEAHLKKSSLAWTMVRPNFFMQNLLASAPTIKEQQAFYLPMGTGQTGMIDVRDIGAVICRALTRSGHEEKSYDLTGPALLSFQDVADTFSDALGTRIAYVDQPMDDYRAFLSQFLKDEWQLDAVCELFAGIAKGKSAQVTDTVGELLDRAPIDLKTFINDHRLAFQPS